VASEKTLLAFDFGTKTIGVAVGQTVSYSDNPLTELKARDGIPNWLDIETLVREWRPHLILVGLPLNMDGSHSELTHRAEKFGKRLHGRLGLPVEMVDERLSSFEAKGAIIERGGSRDFKQQGVDALAAKFILDSWLAAAQRPAGDCT
jgi:putative Holliday junction resolvase